MKDWTASLPSAWASSIELDRALRLVEIDEVMEMAFCMFDMMVFLDSARLCVRIGTIAFVVLTERVMPSYSASRVPIVLAPGEQRFASPWARQSRESRRTAASPRAPRMQTEQCARAIDHECARMRARDHECARSNEP
jgi:hypothetical protein